jgi:sugar phosphate isomerase/epimerase
MHPRLSVSAVSSWRWSLDEDLAFWHKAGIHHVGLSLRKLTDVGLDKGIARVRDAGLRVSNVVELGWCSLASRETWPAHQDALLAAVGAAASIGGCLVLTTGPAHPLEWDAAADALGEMLEPVTADAAERGVVLTVEPTSPLRLDLSFVTTLRDGVDVARRVGCAVCMEINSCFAERDLADTLREGRDVLAHVQVSDFVVGSLCTPDRAVPGDGDIPLARILGTVLETGYAGAFELELVGPRIEEEGYGAAIRRGIEHLDRLLGQSSA